MASPIREKAASEDVHPAAASNSAENQVEIGPSNDSTQKRPPNGGVKAWLQVLGAFFIYFNTWGKCIDATNTGKPNLTLLLGLVAAFGTFQAYYEKELLRDYTPFQISTIGSLQSFLMVFLGLVAGPVYDIGYARQLLWLGSLLIVVGTVTQSISTELWHLLLSQGFCIGVGMGSLAILGVALPSLWFTHRLPLANGIAASGSGAGGLLLPAMFRSLQPDIGFGWTVRIIALIAAITMGISTLILQTPKVSQKRREWIDRSAFRDTAWLLFLFGCFVAFLGMYTPFVYVQSYALNTGTTSSQLALYLLSILNGASILGRIIPLIFAHRAGPMNMITMITFILSISAFCLIIQKSASLIIFVVIYGFCCGTFFALQPTTFVRLTPNRSFIGTRFGMAFSVMSIALLFGPPISGALLREFGYHAAWIWAGVCLAMGGVLIFASRVCSGGWTILSRV